MKQPLFYALALCALLASCRSGRPDGQTEAEQLPVEEIIRYEYGIPVDSFRVVEGTVRSGQSLSVVLGNLGAPASVQNQLLWLPDSVFDVRKFRAGNRYSAFYTLDSVSPRLEYFVYHKDVINSVVLHLADTLHVEKSAKEVRTETRLSEAVITTSLWNAATDNHLNPSLALELSDIYAWTIDFFGLQTQDAFKVYYDELFVDSVSVGIGQIYAASFLHGGRERFAFYFEKDDLRGFFDEEGNSLRKAFLKAPLNFKRISSRFTYARRHPIFKTVRPHTGVDYAAPAGTPVVSIGDGVVISKGYQGGGGNTVKIRHNSIYTTAYLHLSRFGPGIQVGTHVTQGQVIGYVGSTGNSTGPHLDFRVWKGGTPIDPLKMEAPPVEPVPEKYRAEFDSIAKVRMEVVRIGQP